MTCGRGCCELLQVYVGLKFNKMLVDMMYRLDEARLKLQPFEMAHMITSPKQVGHRTWVGVRVRIRVITRCFA